ncbi:solute carrier organic anion transporter family member 4A1-like [Octopus sinensis]|uniref:Solute carrier organic anion transporter family member n=1 Tax=Octopus sinensis TaxID=2607531 RepID=A0A6P7SAQ3_9MOLL|nr:solute carrier organic anion transporter family member 4A1-like [Octopus sinensis]
MTGPISYTAMSENGGISPPEKNGKLPTCHTRLPPDNMDDNINVKCGWGSIRPSLCQRFGHPKWILFLLSLAGAAQGMVVNGFVNVVISNIERRYDLSSTESGTIASCYDIASVVCLIPISYFGGLGRKPRYLGIGVFVMGIGSFMFSLPHFLSGNYKYVTTQNVCTETSLSNGTSVLHCIMGESVKTLSNYKYLFFLGQLLHGAGASPLYTLGVTYLDENLSVRTAPVYIGIFYTMSIIGPAFGYLLGGKFLDYYVDIGRVDTSSISMKSGNAKFVGAWWIGFLLSGLYAILISLPICGFPRELPGATKYRTEREAEVYHQKNNEEWSPNNASTDSPNLKMGWKAILSSLKILTSNPTFMFLNLSAACESIILSGFATFAPKFIESQFSLSASVSAVYVGYALVPAGGGGTFLGGVLVRMLKLKVRGIIRMCLGLSTVLLVLMLIFLLRCQNNSFVGINVPYSVNRSSSPFVIGNLKADCNSDCHCSNEDYDPICSNDGSIYFSPCYAGCKTIIDGYTKKYANCSCIQSNNSKFDYAAVSGKCPNQCNHLSLFMPFFAMIMLITFTISMPALTATLRCVPQKQRSFGLGIQWILARCFGSIPGPIMFGKMIDLTCQFWQQTCQENGSCYVYDNERMGLYLMALTLVVKALSCLFFFLALLMYKAAPASNPVNLASDSTSSALSTFSQRPPSKVKHANSMQTCLDDDNSQCERTLMEDVPSPTKSFTS